MAIRPNSLPEAILRYADALPEGGVLSPKEFLHLGSRSAVDQAFSRLARSGKLLRARRGLYTVMLSSKFGEYPPPAGMVAQSIAAKKGEIVVPHGASAANVLGLTEQNPIREVYLTSGPTRTLKLGRMEVPILHAPRWMLALGARPAGTAVRALKWLGPLHVERSVATLRKTLPVSEWQVLVSARATLPGWMAQAIGKEAARG